MYFRKLLLTLLITGIACATPARNEPGTSAQSGRSARSIVLDGVTIVDVEAGSLIPNQRVVISGNRIQRIGSAETVSIPDKAEVIDIRGKYLIPGLWDMHTHSEAALENYSKLYIANGITGVRDAASEWPLDSMVKWHKQILEGTRIGPPRQILSGHSLDEGRCVRKAALHTCVADSVDAIHVVDSLRAAGADMLKTYNLSPRMYFIIAQEARRLGMPFGGHTRIPGLQASDSGARIIDHSTLNRPLVVGCLYYEATIEQCRPFAERFARNGTWWVPTWIFPPRIAGRLQSRFIYAHFDRFITNFWNKETPLRGLYDELHQGFLMTDSSIVEMKYLNERPRRGSVVDSLGYMYVVRNAGLPVLAGTDTYGKRLTPGFSLHAELATYVAEGMTPLEALQTATLNPAKFLHGTDSLGTVGAGKLADLVILDANPLEDIVNTTTIRAVVANGRYFDREQLDMLLTQVRERMK